MSTTAIVCHCSGCEYFIKTFVQPAAIGTHACTQCNELMEVYIAQGAKQVVRWHDPAVEAEKQETHG